MLLVLHVDADLLLFKRCGVSEVGDVAVGRKLLAIQKLFVLVL